ncbi:MAG: urease accessory UreF family protein [Treponema sp.]|nr:urease accessory UreF family protein [Treponema sp.]
MDFSFFELLQLNDATFPIGSYTFSWGLETFVQQGIIHDSKSAEVFIGSELSGSFLYSDLLAVRLAWEASGVGSAGEAHCANGVGKAGEMHSASGVGSAGEMHCASGVGKANEAHSANCTGNAPEPNNASLVCTVPSWQKLQALDEIYGASRGPFELREGSRKLATRFEKTTDAFCEIPLLANGAHGENSTGRTSEMHGAKTAAYQAVYFPVAYGAHCAERGIPLEECLAAFTYSQVSARVTTCVKLVPLSQSEGQRILYSLMKNFSDLVAKCFTLSENDLCRSSPGLDLRAMQHEYLYSRLYSN